MQWDSLGKEVCESTEKHLSHQCGEGSSVTVGGCPPHLLPPPEPG